MHNLPPEFGSISHYYQNFYARILGKSNQGVFSFLWKYPHKLMERSHKSNKDLQLLEIGIGAGEHLEFVTPDYQKYLGIDLNPRVNPKLEDTKIIVYKADCLNLPFENKTFDRVIATCLLAHLADVESALIEWVRVCNIFTGGARLGSAFLQTFLF